MGVDPPPLPVQGHLLAELGYLEELRAAIALDLSVQTLMEYRKDGRGPAFTVVGRTVLYHPTKLGEWLANGGTRQFEEAASKPRSGR